MYGVAILPTGTRINVTKPEANEYHESTDVDYVLADLSGKPVRVASSCGRLSGFGLGTRHDFHHDQTGRRLGYLQVVGIVDYRGTNEGIVPATSLPLAVFK